MQPTIAVQTGLEELRERLVQAGYRVVGIEETIEPVEAIVYSGVTCEWEGGTTIENVEMNLNSTGITENILMLNVAQMSVEEAVDLIKSRVER